MHQRKAHLIRIEDRVFRVPDLAGTEEAGDDGGGDAIVGRDHRI